jgi:hypothetical protein
MTDETETTDETTEESLADQFEAEAADEQSSGDPTDDAGNEPAANGGLIGADAADTGADVGQYLLKGALVMLVVLGVVATLQFYLSAQTAISRLASTQYRPAFIAAFNLVVLLAVGVGIAQVVRRLR